MIGYTLNTRLQLITYRHIPDNETCGYVYRIEFFAFFLSSVSTLRMKRKKEERTRNSFINRRWLVWSMAGCRPSRSRGEGNIGPPFNKHRCNRDIRSRVADLLRCYFSYLRDVSGNRWHAPHTCRGGKRPREATSLRAWRWTNGGGSVALEGKAVEGRGRDRHPVITRGWVMAAAPWLHRDPENRGYLSSRWHKGI